MLVKNTESDALTGNSQINESAWQAWLLKNAAQDKFRLARRIKVIGLMGVIVTLTGLVWIFTS